MGIMPSLVPLRSTPGRSLGGGQVPGVASSLVALPSVSCPTRFRELTIRNSRQAWISLAIHHTVVKNLQPLPCRNPGGPIEPLCPR
jgi:hypothetical protein